jgi:hypothetical protein
MVVFLMKREEAIEVLKNLFEICTTLDGRWLSLMPPNAGSKLSQGYQIIIKTPLDELTRNCMQDVLVKYHLTIKITETDTFVIYKPYQENRLTEH